MRTELTWRDTGNFLNMSRYEIVFSPDLELVLWIPCNHANGLLARKMRFFEKKV